MRSERILELVRRLAPPGAERGITAAEVARAAGIMRHNASADLNELCRAGLVRKVKGRPVLFWAAPDRGEAGVPVGAATAGTAASALSQPAPGTFANLVGAEGSLRAAIEQAKAAILYPPQGLPTLIVGPTGVGKSRLAEAMYAYGVAAGRLPSTAPFIVFNCADYASNPQLLLSQLFGHVKGAFTGADQENVGLVAKANGGVLFLDEVHRLPPDGQEMLFLLMDKGVYRPLGDTATARHVTLTLIGATSEDPGSTLLRTFVRRFPVVITLPELEARPLEERLALLELFLREEANRVGVTIAVSPLALVALLSFPAAGNVGELRSAVQLGCAKAYLDYVTTGADRKAMPFYITHLAPEIQLTYLSNHPVVRQAEQLAGLEDRFYAPHLPGQDSGKTLSHDDYVLPDVYGELRRRTESYLNSGLDAKAAQLLVRIDLDYYLRRLLFQGRRGTRMPPGLLNATQEFVHAAGVELGQVFGPDMVTGLALHFAATSSSGPESTGRILALVTHCPREYAVVRRLAERLETALGRTLSAGEIGFVALFLAAHSQPEAVRSLAVVVICHGEQTASSMAAVANRLLGTDRVLGVDMPLDQSIEETLQRAVGRVKEKGQASGVLLLVDMGSLTTLGPALQQATGLPVAVVPLVTTAAVVEAARVAGKPGTDLAQVVAAVQDVYRLESSELLRRFPGKRVILTTCLTGKGTARKLAAFLTEALPPNLREQIAVQAVEERDLSSPSLLMEGWRENVIAVAGTVDPHLPGVPFIGMESILFGDGLPALLRLAGEEQPQAAEAASVSRSEAIALARKFVAENTVSIPGGQAAELAVKALEQLEGELERSLSPGQVARWVIHLAFAIERLVTGGPVFPCSEEAYLQQHHGWLLQLLRQVVRPVEDEWKVTFPPGEIGFLAMIVLSA